MRFEFKSHCFEFPSDHCVLFGILNITPDSFSDGGKFFSSEKALEHALQLEKDGADVVDIGGESSRPGATPIPAECEMERILPVIQLLKCHLQIPISVDTTKAIVAEAALSAGAHIINDISGLAADPQMASVVTSSGAGLILMHHRGFLVASQPPHPHQHVVEEVKCELLDRYRFALSVGIPQERIALDPGIGFAKTPEQNLVLLRNLKAFTMGGANAQPFVNCPMMIGVSRKSFLGGKVTERALGTLVAEIWAYQQGVRIIRTHDVAAIRRAIGTFLAIQNTCNEK